MKLPDVDFDETPDRAARQLADSIGSVYAAERQWHKAFKALDQASQTASLAAQRAATPDAHAALLRRVDHLDATREALADLFHAQCEQPPVPTDATKEHQDRLRHQAAKLANGYKKCLTMGLPRDDATGLFIGMQCAMLIARGDAMDKGLRAIISRLKALETDVRKK